jgi:hypothetical protein
MPNHLVENVLIPISNEYRGIPYPPSTTQLLKISTRIHTIQVKMVLYHLSVGWFG